MPKPFGFAEPTARILSKVAKERHLLSKFAWNVIQPAPSASYIRSYIVVPGSSIAAATTSDGGATWTMHHATCNVYVRNVNTAEKFSQDPANTITADGLVQAIDLGENDITRRVFNATTGVIPANKPTMAVQDTFGDLYIVNPPAAPTNQVIFFELTAPITPSSSTADHTTSSPNAKICGLISIGGHNEYDVSGGADIIVFDPFGFAVWGAPAGFRGLAALRSDGAYDILFMEHIDGLFEFTVYTDRDPSLDHFTVTVTNSFQQGGRDINTSSGAITCKDVQHLYDRALVGGKGIGLYDYNSNTYRVIQCQQQATMAYCLCDQTGGTNTTGAVTIDSFVAISPSPFNLTPGTLPTQAYNIYNHLCANDDRMLIVWDEGFDRWVIINVLKKSHNTLTNVRQKSGNTQIEAEQVQAALEYIDIPSYSDKIAIGPCTTTTTTT